MIDTQHHAKEITEYANMQTLLRRNISSNTNFFSINFLLNAARKNNVHPICVNSPTAQNLSVGKSWSKQKR